MKLLERLRADPRIDELLVEQPLAQCKPTYFVHLNYGWCMAPGTGEAHCFGEDNLRNVQRTLRSVCKCECDECVAALEDEIA